MILISKVVIAQQQVPYANLAYKDSTWKRSMALFLDDFNDNYNQWQNNGNKTNFEITNGNLIVYGGALKCDKLNNIDQAKDVIFEIRIKMIDDFSRAQNKEWMLSQIFKFWNLEFRYVIKEKLFQIVDLTKSTPTTYTWIYKSNDINVYEFSTIQIVSKNKTASIYFNGSYLTSYNYTLPLQGTIFQPNAFTCDPENLYGCKRIIVDYIYIYRNYSTLEEEDYTIAKNRNDFDSYLTKYPNGKYYSEISALKEDYFYDLALSGFVSECDNYLNNYPQGKYLDKIVNLKTERQLYKKALDGGLTDYNAYLLKYPSGTYSAEITKLKNKKTQEINRANKIKTNSNKALWKLGCKLCNQTTNGIICGVLNQWNENKTKVLVKILTSPGGSYEGEQLTKNNTIWVSSSGKGWHLCLEDEIQTSLNNDNSNPKSDVITYELEYWKPLSYTFFAPGYVAKILVKKGNIVNKILYVHVHEPYYIDFYLKDPFDGVTSEGDKIGRCYASTNISDKNKIDIHFYVLPEFEVSTREAYYATGTFYKTTENFHLNKNCICNITEVFVDYRNSFCLPSARW